MSVLAVSFALYTLLIVALGVHASRFAQRSDEDYFLAGRSLGPWVAALSASASGSSGWVTMGLVGFGFANGVSAYWLIPGVVFGIGFNWLVLAGRMRNRAAALGAVTLPDLFAFHFRERLPILRLISVAVILAAMFLYVAAQLAASGKAFEAGFEGVSYRSGVVIGAVVILAYTVIGGFRAACWTDFAQALVMLAALVGMPIYLLITHGGFGFVADQLRAVDPNLLAPTPHTSGLALIGFLFGSGAMGVNLGYPGQPHVLVRYMALRDARDAKIGAVVALVWAALIYWGAVSIGLFARALSEAGADWGQSMLLDPATKGELALVLASIHMLPQIVSGLILAAILAAIASTADSQLIVAASSVANDVYARLIDKGARDAHLFINRLVVLALGAAATLLVINKDINIYRFVLTYGWAMLGAAFGPQMILMLLWRRASYAGCIAGMLSGFAIAIIWPMVYDAQATGVEAYNLTVAFVAAMIVNAIVSVLFPGGAMNSTQSTPSHHA